VVAPADVETDHRSHGNIIDDDAWQVRERVAEDLAA
jgi:hypothetical protein